MTNKNYWKNQYNDIKSILIKQGYATKYFNFTWFKLYIECWRKTKENFKNGIFEKCYDPLFTTKFYNLNSGCYCQFLCVFSEFQKEVK